jgi:hypothetical protein
MAKDLKSSEFTSIKERIENTNTWLSGFIRLIPEPHPYRTDVKILSRRIFGKGDNDLPFYLSSYIDLVDETGRCLRGDKRGFISEKVAKAIDEIGINPNSWLDELKGFKSIGFSAVGTAVQLKEYSAKTKRKWTLGIKLSPALE